jgi:hypothetical protein
VREKKTMSKSDDAEKTELEKVFELLRKGNDDEDNKLFWNAVHSFTEAQKILKLLANPRTNKNNNLSTSIASTLDENVMTPEEAEKFQITTLYQQQAELYFNRARTCLINALTDEANFDRQQQPNETVEEASNTKGLLLFHQKMSDEQCIERIKLFGTLFAKELVDLPIQQYFKDLSVPIEEQQSTLEGRLRDLNQSLPVGFKTDDERMRIINKGLSRLGLSSIYTDSDKPKPFVSVFPIEPVKSETDQIADVISQAHDEVALLGSISKTATTTEAGEATGGTEGMDGMKLKVNNVSFKAEDSTDEDESDIEKELDEDDDDAELAPEVCRDIQDKLADAQTALAELMAMFEVDTEGDAAIQFDQGLGKNTLKRSRISLLQVTRAWNNNS